MGRRRSEPEVFLRAVRRREDRETPAGYPFDIPAIRSLHELRLSAAVTFLVGENGSGKSTLLEAIALLLGLNPEGGSQNFNTRARPSESELYQHLVPVRSHRRPRRRFFLRAESLFNVATEAEDYAVYGWERLHERSHGEAFLWLVTERFGDEGLYLMDEPEAALSPRRQLVMLARMRQLVEGGSQLIIATHSPILLSYPNALIYQLDAEGMRPVRLEETEHFQITRDFLANPDVYLRHIFDE